MSGYWSNNPEKYEEVERNAAVLWLAGVHNDVWGNEVFDDVVAVPNLVEALQAEQPAVFRAIMDHVPVEMVRDQENAHFESMVP